MSGTAGIFLKTFTLTIGSQLNIIKKELKQKKLQKKIKKNYMWNFLNYLKLMIK